MKQTESLIVVFLDDRPHSSDPCSPFQERQDVHELVCSPNTSNIEHT